MCPLRNLAKARGDQYLDTDYTETLDWENLRQKVMTTGMRNRLTRYGDDRFALFLRKAFIKAMGYSEDALSRTVVGITDTGSGYNACHRTVPDIIEAVKRGVMLAGGLLVAGLVTSETRQRPPGADLEEDGVVEPPTHLRHTVGEQDRLADL